MFPDFEGTMKPEVARIASALVWTANRLNRMNDRLDVNRQDKQKRPGSRRWRGRYTFAALGLDGPLQRRELVIDSGAGEIFESITRLELDMGRGFIEQTYRGKFVYIDRSSASRRGKIEDHLTLIGGALEQLEIHTQFLRYREMNRP